MTRRSILLVDDDPRFLADMGRFLGAEHALTTEADGDAALSRLGSETPDVVLLDLDLGSRTSGFDVLDRLRGRADAPPVIVLTGDRDVRSAVRAMKQGAFHYVCKPPDLGELMNLIDLACERRDLMHRVEALQSEIVRLSGGFVAADATMRDIVARIDRVGPTTATVLITGECGTGKEMVARLLHAHGRRRDEPFVGVNCAAVPAELIESEMFGHERGSFTGADRTRAGKCELAGRGTLFLDEIGDATEMFQLKLLRVLEEKAFTRVGGDRELPLQARICAATSRDLAEAIDRGTFRPELFYRLNVYQIHVPPLRERAEDIPVLAAHFVERSAREFGLEAPVLSDDALVFLREQSWRGNVRELRNVIERGVLECSGDVIEPSDLVLSGTPGTEVFELGPYDEAKAAAMATFKRRYLAAQLRRTGGNVTEAARHSGIPRQSFGRMVREVGLHDHDPPTD